MTGLVGAQVARGGTTRQKRAFGREAWDPTAQTDMQALRARFDSNGDGKLTAADTDFSKFARLTQTNFLDARLIVLHEGLSPAGDYCTVFSATSF